MDPNAATRPSWMKMMLQISPSISMPSSFNTYKYVNKTILTLLSFIEVQICKEVIIKDGVQKKTKNYAPT